MVESLITTSQKEKGVIRSRLRHGCANESERIRVINRSLELSWKSLGKEKEIGERHR